MSTLSVATVNTKDSLTDLTIRTGNTSAGSIVLKSNNPAINIIGALNNAKGAAVVAATTTDIYAAADGNSRHVTGTGVTITSLGTAPQAGVLMLIYFDGAGNILTNGANLSLPGAANIITAAGDRAFVWSDTTTALVVVDYIRASGVSVISNMSAPINLASTSGTSVLFSGANAPPIGTKRITIALNGVSTNGTSVVMFQLGTGGSVTATGYLGAASAVTTGVGTVGHTTGFNLSTSGSDSAAAIRHGSFTLVNVTGNIWALSGNMSLSNTPNSVMSSGIIALAGAIDRVNITTVAGTDAFDAGSISVFYEQ